MGEGHSVTPDGQKWIGFSGSSKSLGHIARLHEEHEAKNGGGSKPGAAVHVRVFADPKRYQQWMDRFDQVSQSKATVVSLAGQHMPREQFVHGYIEPIAHKLRDAIAIVRAMNAGTRDEAQTMAKDAQSKALAAQGSSESGLDKVATALDAGHYGTAYSTFVHTVRLAQAAREVIGAYNTKVIEDADHAVTALETTRDVGFTVLAALNPADVVLITATATVLKAADDWAGGEDVTKIAFDVVLGILVNRLGKGVSEAVIKAWGPTLEHWIDNAAGGMIARGASSPLVKKFVLQMETEGEATMRVAAGKLAQSARLTTQETAVVLAGLRKYVVEKRIAHKMLDWLVDKPKEIVNKFCQVMYQQMVSKNPHMPVKERCEKMLEELHKELHKESDARSNLFWAAFSHVANAL